MCQNFDGELWLLWKKGGFLLPLAHLFFSLLPIVLLHTLEEKYVSGESCNFSTTLGSKNKGLRKMSLICYMDLQRRTCPRQRAKSVLESTNKSLLFELIGLWTCRLERKLSRKLHRKSFRLNWLQLKIAQLLLTFYMPAVPPSILLRRGEAMISIFHCHYILVKLLNEHEKLFFSLHYTAEDLWSISFCPLFHLFFAGAFCLPQLNKLMRTLSLSAAPHCLLPFGSESLKRKSFSPLSAFSFHFARLQSPKN